MARVDKVAIIGIDGACPSLLLDRWIETLPNIRGLVNRGMSGRLASCIPPTTIPAWSCMATGRDPGSLGIYGYRNRRDWTYEEVGTATNLEVRKPRLWDIVGRHGLSSITVGVPQTFPMMRAPRGYQVTGLLTPGTDSPYTHPPQLADEIEKRSGAFIFDVQAPHKDEPAYVVERVRKMGEQRFDTCRHLLANEPWSLAWMVDTGVDRLQHALWHCIDPDHPHYEPSHPLARAIHDYYRFVDEQIGKILEHIDPERTAVWVVSEHGAQAATGRFCLNEWLRREGLLRLRSAPKEPRRLSLAEIDWSRTQAWALGGHCGRIFFNREGREPLGIVRDSEMDALSRRLATKLESLPDPLGQPMQTRVYHPDQLYAATEGYPPDLLVCFDDCRVRVSEVVGGQLQGHSGADFDIASHTTNGVYVLAAPGMVAERSDASLYDVLPTVLQQLRLPVPKDTIGRPLT